MKLILSGIEIDLNKEDLQKALQDDSNVTLDVDENIVIRSKEDDEKLVKNLREEAKSIGAEIGRKEILKGLGVEGDGVHKDAEEAIKLVNKAVDTRVKAGIEESGAKPNEQIEAIKAEFEKDKQTLLTRNQELESQVNLVKGEFESYKFGQVKKEIIMGAIPDNTILPKEDIFTLVSSKFNIENRDGKTVLLNENGEVVKNSVLDPVDPKDAVKSFFDTEGTKYLSGASGGRSDKDSGSGSGKQSMDDFLKESIEKGWSAEERFKEIEARSKAGTLDVK